MKKVILGLLLVAGSLPAIAQTTEKTNDMDRIELHCRRSVPHGRSGHQDT